MTHRVLVTGAGGLVGGALTTAAASAGLRVVAVVRPGGRPAPPGVEALVTDLRDADALVEAPAVDAVLHAAARLPVSYADDDPSGAENRAIDDAVLRFAERTRTPVAYASTVALYARTEELTGETAPLDDHGSYLAETARTERLGRELAAGCGVPFAALRLSSPYGPGMGERGVLGTFVARAVAGKRFGWLGTGEREQDFVHVADVADAFLRAARGPGGVYNVAAGRPVTMRELALLVAAAAGDPALAAAQAGDDPQDGRRVRLDVSAAAADLGWAPVTPLGDGISALVAHRRRQALA